MHRFPRSTLVWVLSAALVVALAVPPEALARRYGGGGGFRGGGRSFGSSRSFSRSSAPSRPRFDESARRSIGRETSRRSFRMSRGLPPGAPRVTPQQLATRDAREQALASSRTPTGYFTPRPGPTVVYNDPFSSSMLQYMSMMWLFNHWGQVDHQRFDEARLRDLERQVAEMKARGMTPDPNYVEPGVDPDLVYRADLLKEPESSHWGIWLLGFLLLTGAGLGLFVVLARRSREKEAAPLEPSVREEDGLYNPLKLRVGDFVSFRTPDLSGRNWSVTRVTEYGRIAGEETFPLVNYELQDRDQRIVLRAVPGAEETAPPDLLVLKVFDEMGYSEDVAQAVRAAEFYVDEDDGTRIVYHPLSDCGEEGWSARTRSVAAAGEAAKEGELRYWDYFRKGDVGRGEMSEDLFFFVEIDQETGWIRMLEGGRITSGDVESYPA